MSKFFFEDLRSDVGIAVKEIFDVSRNLTMESLLSNDKYLEFNSEINREPLIKWSPV